MSKEIRLVGIPMPKILEHKLPTVKEVMCVFFYQLQVLKCSIKQSAKNVIDQVIELWKKNQIPTCETANAVKKILRYHNQWLKLQKSFTRRKSLAQNQNEMKFQNELKMLFDVVNQKSLKTLDENIKKLYLNQKSGTRKEFLYNNIHASNITENLMEVDEDSKYLQHTIIINFSSSIKRIQLIINVQAYYIYIFYYIIIFFHLKKNISF